MDRKQAEAAASFWGNLPVDTQDPDIPEDISDAWEAAYEEFQDILSERFSEAGYNLYAVLDDVIQRELAAARRVPVFRKEDAGG